LPAANNIFYDKEKNAKPIPSALFFNLHFIRIVSREAHPGGQGIKKHGVQQKNNLLSLAQVVILSIDIVFRFSLVIKSHDNIS